MLLTWNHKFWKTLCLILLIFTAALPSPARAMLPGDNANPPFAPRPLNMSGRQALLCQPHAPVRLRESNLQIPILMYHFVGRASLESAGRSTSRYNVTAADFEQQLQLLQQLGYTTITASEAAAALRGESTLPPRPIVLTFDDGWVEQYDIAFPLLQKYQMRGTFYVPSTYPVGRRFVTWEQLQEMAEAGMEIGSHSRRHLQLTTLDAADAADEIARSKIEIETRLGIPVTSFAYPYGAASDLNQQQAVQAGYTNAVGLGASSIQGPGQLYYLRRTEVQGTFTLEDFIKYLPWRGENTSLCDPLLRTFPIYRAKVTMGF